MRIVRKSEAVWNRVGVGASESASLVGCPASWAKDELVLVLWAKKVQDRELVELKREAAQMRKMQGLEQGTPLWHQSRYTSIGGTESAGLVGAAYRDSKSLSDAMRTFKTKGPLGTKIPEELLKGGYENENMARGKKLEPIAREKYQELMGWATEPICCLHDNYDFVRASLDGLRSDDQVFLEIKCPGLKNHLKFKEIEQIEDPLYRQLEFANNFNYYRYQCLWTAIITNSHKCHFVSYNEEIEGQENQLALIELHQEPEEQSRLLQRGIEFWEFVEARVAPPASWLKPCFSYPTFVQV